MSGYARFGGCDLCQSLPLQTLLDRHHRRRVTRRVSGPRVVGEAFIIEAGGFLAKRTDGFHGIGSLAPSSALAYRMMKEMVGVVTDEPHTNCPSTPTPEKLDVLY
jgi:hypothetical protein